MAKRCAREECGKSVYPMEELKVLDKVWHKTCFKCTVCGMALNMKNYKGYNKMPYCEPHYPKTVASVVADTPEMRRIAENTKNQSQIAYHAEYEKMRGTKIEVADDPETMRHKQNTQTQSSVAYHGELEKKQKYEAVRLKDLPGDESNSLPKSQIWCERVVTNNGFGGINYGIELYRAEAERTHEDDTSESSAAIPQSALDVQAEAANREFEWRRGGEKNKKAARNGKIISNNQDEEDIDNWPIKVTIYKKR